MKKIHRFLLPADLSHQIRDVLKMNVGEVVDLMDGQGMEARAKIVSVDDSVEVDIDAVRQNRNEPTTKVILYCAILKHENFELVVQKATEVGVSEIVPVISSRTVKTGLKLERLQKIAAEAAEQSGRGVVPTIAKPISFTQALNDSGRADQCFFFDPSGSMGKKPEARPDPIRSVGLFVGPEGGWTDQELKEAKAAGLTPTTLGPLVLRGETAAIVATYLAAHGRLSSVL